MDILDLGCGTGILFDILRRVVGEQGSVTGVDFSFKMAEKAHRNFPFANVNVVDTDATDLPFADSSFDMAVAFSAFPHFSNQRRAVDEIHRVVKNGASCYVIHLESSREINKVHQRIGGAVEHDEIPPEGALREMFDSSKFENVNIVDHPGLFLLSAVSSK
jgi:demethylmenaquinone methyltransferase/2-methoxy-6-polyprenyl-1,4-benzoquinol methylase